MNKDMEFYMLELIGTCHLFHILVKVIDAVFCHNWAYLRPVFTNRPMCAPT